MSRVILFQFFVILPLVLLVFFPILLYIFFSPHGFFIQISTVESLVIPWGFFNNRNLREPTRASRGCVHVTRKGRDQGG